VILREIYIILTRMAQRYSGSEIAGEQRRHLDLVLESKKPLFTEINILLPKINLWLDVQLIPIFTEQGTIKSVMGVARDITTRKLAEETLRETTEYLQNLFDYANAPIITWDPGFRITRFNHAFENLTGRSQEEVLGKTLDLLFPDESRQASMVLIQKTLEGERWETVEIPILNTDGSIKTGLWNSANVLGPHGKLTATIAQGIDITGRKLAEEQLIEFNERFKNVARATNDIVWDWELKTNNLWWSDSIYTVFGYQHEDIEPTIESWYNRLHPEDRDRTVTSIHAVIDGGGLSWSGEYRFRKADSSYAYVFDRGFVIRDIRGNAVRMIGAMLDITERKRAEEKLKNYSGKLEEMVSERTRELREAQDQLVKKEKLAILGKLAGGVGHELRNPLGAIKNAAYFLNMALENQDPDVKEMVELINKEVIRSEDIISSLLDFARPKTLTLRKGAVNTVVNEALKRNPVPNNVAVISNLDETLPDIQADSDKLLQVFNNIISNAFQAMPEGGSLTITSKKSGPGGVSIAFADTGVGISAENMKKLFEPLFTTKIKGIGLGMVVTKTIVESHGGHIDVQSEGGKGTTITVNLPMSGRKED
jgi:PAS domain S-box-containing protein